MYTLNDLIQTLKEVREAVDSIETKGKTNALHIVFAIDRCDDMINSLSEFIRVNSKEGVTDGEPDTTVS